jgi:hypothetical protein
MFVWRLANGKIHGEPLTLPRVFTSEAYASPIESEEIVPVFPARFENDPRLIPDVHKYEPKFRTEVWGFPDDPITEALYCRAWLRSRPELRRTRMELKTLETGMILDTVRLRHLKMLAQVSIVVSDGMVESIKKVDKAIQFLEFIKSLGPEHRVMNPLDEETGLPVFETKGIGIVFAKDRGCLKTFFGMEGVRIEEVTDAVFLKLVEMARAKSCGLIVWSESAFAKIDRFIDGLTRAYDRTKAKYGIWPKGTVRLFSVRSLGPSFYAWEVKPDPIEVQEFPEKSEKCPVPWVLCEWTLQVWEKELISHGMCEPPQERLRTPSRVENDSLSHKL